jgi:hypothetical protein
MESERGRRLGHGETIMKVWVEDSEWWLPCNRGCSQVWSLMKTAPEVLLDITMLWFAISPEGVGLFAADPSYQVRVQALCYTPPNASSGRDARAPPKC